MDEITIEDYDPRWPLLFAEEAARVRTAIGGAQIVAVEHFGSTAVPHLAAKPVIDILVGVRSLSDARDQAVASLEALGYAFWYDNPDPGHLFFVRGLPPNGPRTHHVHIVEAATPDPKCLGAPFWERLLFRDYLRTHPNEARCYADLKRTLALRFAGDREGYTEAKSSYVQSVMRKARDASDPGG